MMIHFNYLFLLVLVSFSFSWNRFWLLCYYVNSWSNKIWNRCEISVSFVFGCLLIKKFFNLLIISFLWSVLLKRLLIHFLKYLKVPPKLPNWISVSFLINLLSNSCIYTRYWKESYCYSLIIVFMNRVILLLHKILKRNKKLFLYYLWSTIIE